MEQLSPKHMKYDIMQLVCTVLIYIPYAVCMHILIWGRNHYGLRFLSHYTVMMSLLIGPQIMNTPLTVYIHVQIKYT